jgi:3-hydroxyisobutyrate dehydrogenase
MKTVGVIGVGNMGLPMAQRLLQSGLSVIACDIDAQRQRLAKEAGCTIADSPAAIAAGADAVLIVVVNAAQIQTVIHGEHGLAHALRQQTPVLCMSTIAPQDASRFAADLQAAGALALDAPVSGGPSRALNGELSLMLAGSDRAMAAAKPVTEKLASRCFALGHRPGDAMKMKLVNNLLAGINLAASAQALAMAKQLGLDPAVALSVIQSSSGASWIGGDRLPRALNNDYAPRAAAHILAKDVDLAVQLMHTAGVAVAGAQDALAAFAGAVASNAGDEDDAVLYRIACGAKGQTAV